MTRINRLFALLVACLLIWAACGARGAELPGKDGDQNLVGLPFALQKCGGGSPTKNEPGFNGVQDFAKFADDWTPTIRKNGYRRFWFEKPGGIFRINAWGVGDTREVQANQWQIAQQLGFTYANDEKLEYCHRKLTTEGKVGEVCYYVGSPDNLPDPYTDGLKAVLPFTRLGKTASLAFDTLGNDDDNFRSAWHRARCTMLVAELHRRGHRVYLEARPSERFHPLWEGLIAGTVAEVRVDKMRPEQFKASFKLGEVIQVVDKYELDEQTVDMEEGVTPLVYKWKTRKASEVQGGTK